MEYGSWRFQPEVSTMLGAPENLGEHFGGGVLHTPTLWALLDATVRISWIAIRHDEHSRCTRSFDRGSL
jgi:hypothetical protein